MMASSNSITSPQEYSRNYSKSHVPYVIELYSAVLWWRGNKDLPLEVLKYIDWEYHSILSRSEYVFYRNTRSTLSINYTSKYIYTGAFLDHISEVVVKLSTCKSIILPKINSTVIVQNLRHRQSYSITYPTGSP